jgi:hypothetical protein
MSGYLSPAKHLYHPNPGPGETGARYVCVMMTHIIRSLSRIWRLGWRQTLGKRSRGVKVRRSP